jgi:hypothetical protein
MPLFIPGHITQIKAADFYVVHDGACLTAENPGKWLMCAHAHANPDKEYLCSVVCVACSIMQNCSGCETKSARREWNADQTLS